MSIVNRESVLSENNTIYIIPRLKELSKGMTGPNFKCGQGFTNENCVADFNNGIMQKRVNYTSAKSEEQFPNSYLYQGVSKNPFEVLPIDLQLKEKSNNWLYLLIGLRNTFKPSEVNKEMNIFITGHQNSFINLFFDFKNKEGFRNGSCVKILLDIETDKEYDKLTISYKVIHSDDTGRDKLKYNYVNESPNKVKIIDFLLSKDNSEIISKFNNFSCNIFIIRHSEALHNLKDVHNDCLKKNHESTCNSKDGIFTMSELSFISNYLKFKNARIYRHYFLNSPLTPNGILQSLSLYKKLKSQGLLKNIRYVSSPLDRAIETLIYATNGVNPNFMDNLQTKLLNTRNRIGNDVFAQILNNMKSEIKEKINEFGRMSSDESNNSSRETFDNSVKITDKKQQDMYKSPLPSSTTTIGDIDDMESKPVFNPFEPSEKAKSNYGIKLPMSNEEKDIREQQNLDYKNGTNSGGKRKSKRKTNKKSKITKKSKQIRKSKKRYQRGCAKGGRGVKNISKRKYKKKTSNSHFTSSKKIKHHHIPLRLIAS